MSEAPRLPDGHLLEGRFRVDALLNDTEYATMYRGTDVTVEQSVVIRSFDLSRFFPEASLPMIKRRFVNEARQLADIVHPNLERLLAAGEEGSLVFLVTEVLDTAQRLDAMLSDSLPERHRAGAILTAILDGLGAAHRLGHPHRDLAPARVRILPDGTVKVTDFALVKLLHTLRGTREGASLLKPYSPPEQVRGDEVGPVSDLYSVGTIAYELLTGGPPYELDDPSLADAILSREVILGPTVPKPLRDFVEQALRKDPAARFPDAATMTAALRDALEESDRPGQDAPSPWEDITEVSRAAVEPSAASGLDETAAPAPPAAEPEAPAPPRSASSVPLPPRRGSPPPAPHGPPAAEAAPESARPPIVVVKRKGASPTLTFTVLLFAALVVGFFINQRILPARNPPAPVEPHDTPDVAASGVGDPQDPTPGTTATGHPAVDPPPEPGLVHSFEKPEAPRVEVPNPLAGVDVAKLSAEEKEALLQKMAAEVRRHVARRDAVASRQALEYLTGAAPNDARFYELESQVLALAIELPPVPVENQEVPLVSVDQPPILKKHHPPAFPKRGPEELREVVVKALIDADGQVVDTVVVEDDEFGDGAIAAASVRAWEFEPAVSKEVRVKVWIAIPIRTGGEWKKPHLQVVSP